MNTYVIERFLTAQDNPPAGCGSYEQALSEIKSGRKTGHWMWYVFPQIQGLGHSGLSKKFGIDSVDEVKAYYNHPVLRARMNEILTVILESREGYTIRMENMNIMVADILDKQIKELEKERGI